MRKQYNLIFLSIALLILPGLSAQAQALQLSGNADCEGWNAVATLTFPDGVFYTNLEYSVVLSDLSGAEISRFDFAGQISRFENPVMMQMYGDVWPLVLDSVYVVQYSFHFLGEDAMLNLDLVCGDAGGETEPIEFSCRRVPGYWKNNSDLWPVETLFLGGLEMDQHQLVSIMRAPVRGNASLLLARELIAAKLNVANGSEDLINDVIEEADFFLIDHPLTERSWRNRIPSTRDLRHALARYNKQDCAESSEEESGMRSELGEKNAVIETTSFNALKAMYR